MRTGDGKPFEIGNRLQIGDRIIETSPETHEIDMITEIRGARLRGPIYCIGRRGAGCFSDLLRFVQPGDASPASDPACEVQR